MQLTQFNDINIKCVIKETGRKDGDDDDDEWKKRRCVRNDAILFVEGVCGFVCHFKLPSRNLFTIAWRMSS